MRNTIVSFLLILVVANCFSQKTTLENIELNLEIKKTPPSFKIEK